MHVASVMREYRGMSILLPFVSIGCLLRIAYDADCAEITNIGVLYPITGLPFDGRKAVAVVPVAIDAAKVKYPNLDFNWSYVDSRCEEVHSVRGALGFIDTFSSGLDVLIGEVCSHACETVGIITSALHKPFIATGCNSDKLSRRDIYDTFTRSVPPFKAMVPAFHRLLSEFNWNHVGILATDEPAYQLLSIAIKNHLHSSNPKVETYLTPTQRRPYNVTSNETSDGLEGMKLMKDHARIILLIMDRNDVLHKLLQAKDLDMYNGDYAFITCDYDLQYGDSEDSSEAELQLLRDVHESLLIVSFKYVESVENDFIKKMDLAFNDSHFQHDKAFKNLNVQNDDILVLQYASYLYDAVMMWANAKSQSVEIGRNGTRLNAESLIKIMRRTNFTGLTREIRFDEDGEIIATEFDVWIVQNGTFVLVFQYDVARSFVQHMIELDDLKWLGGGNKKPLAEPSCGWKDERCKDQTYIIIAAGCCAFVAALLGIGLLYCNIKGFKKYKRNKERLSNWKVQWIDIIPIGTTGNSQHLTLLPSRPASDAADRKSSDALTSLKVLLTGMSQLYTLAGVYKNRVVAIKLIERDSINLADPEMHDELQQMLDIKHDNVNEFVGVCLDAPHVCVLMLYAHKGSLQDMINNETINISNELRMSLATDITRGMEYLHSSDVGAHGHLTSSNCLVSQHWVCKVTDYGLKLLKLNEKSEVNSYQEALDLMWCSPELLRKELDDEDRFYGTKEGDIYSFGIIISELVTVSAPYQQELINVTPADIIYKVRRRSQPPFRPALTKTNNAEMDKWNHLAETCWQEDPQKRPSFSSIKEMLRIMNDGKRVNIMDWLYKTLEESLEMKTTQLIEERAKIQRWMYSTFPKSMADVLIAGGEVGPQMSDPVTVCLCGLVGMEKLVASLTPTQIAEAVSGLHRLFDSIVNLYYVHKVGNDTSSEAMMFVSGLPERSLTHAVDMCTLALNLLSALNSSNVSYIQLKIGISTGPVVGVVIGKLIPSYRVYGKTVHQCLAIQAASQAQKIRISAATNTHLTGIGTHQFVTQPAGQVKTKDDEKLESFWLRDKIGLDLPLPEGKI